MVLRHVTTRQRYATIRTEGLLVARADLTAKIKGVWMLTPSRTPYGIIHTMRKHGAALEDVVVLTINVTKKMRKSLRKFKNVTTGYQAYYSIADIPPSAISPEVIPGSAFGASISE